MPAAFLLASEALLLASEALLLVAEAFLLASEALLLAAEAFLLASEAFLLEAEALLLESEAFLLETEAFLLETEAFLLETETFLLETEDLLLESEAFLLETEAFLLELEVFLLETEAFLLETEAFLLESEAPLLEVENIETIFDLGPEDIFKSFTGTRFPFMRTEGISGLDFNADPFLAVFIFEGLLFFVIIFGFAAILFLGIFMLKETFGEVVDFLGFLFLLEVEALLTSSSRSFFNSRCILLDLDLTMLCF